MKKFLASLRIFIYLYQQGFFFSKNVHKDKSGYWGFFRFNYEKGNQREYGIFDIDFQDKQYYHVHADSEDTLFRIDLTCDKKFTTDESWGEDYWFENRNTYYG